VTFPQAYDWQSQGKIDQAYGLAYAQSLSQTVNSSMSSDQRYLQANRAGQAATIATVSAVTGQKIDHFAEVKPGRVLPVGRVVRAASRYASSHRTAARTSTTPKLGLQRGARRLQQEQGRGPVPPPEGAAGAGVRP